jgi:ferredoxin
MREPVDVGVPPPDVKPDDCLNRRHSSLGCTRCIASCPVGALDLEGGRPHLDVSECVSCGACAHACPVDAISPRAWGPENVLTANLEHTGTGPIGISCDRNPGGNRPGPPVEAMALHPRCLAGIGVTTLLELMRSSEGDVWLDDSACAGCDIGSTHRVIERTVAATNTLAKSRSSPRRVRLATQTTTTSSPTSGAELISCENLTVSRRAMFGLLRSRAHAAPAAPISSSSPTTALDEQKTPLQRTALLEELATWPGPALDVASADLPHAQVHIDPSKCSACGLCARFCPTAALCFKSLDGEFDISFEAATCVDCGICSTACVEDAIGFGPSINGARLVSGPPTRLVNGDLIDCIECGAPTASRPSVPKCSPCRHGLGPIKPLGDDRGLLADMFSTAAQPWTVAGSAMR